MKKLIILSVVLIIVMAAGAKDNYKVLKSSEKNRPAWVGVSGNGYICLICNGKTLEEAQEICMRKLKTEIIEAIAINIVSENSEYSQQRTENDQTTFVNEFVSNTSQRAASLPFINDISISKCTATYWEELQDKTTKAIVYAYSIQYPFTEATRRKYIDQFNELDRSMVTQAKDLETGASSISSVEQILNGITKLQEISGYFFDNQRKAWAESILKRYLQMPKKLSVHGQSGKNNTYMVWIELDGRKLTPSGNPILKSECANDLKYQRKGDDYLITYDTGGCLDDEQNFLEVTFRVLGTTLKEKFVIE